MRRCLVQFPQLGLISYLCWCGYRSVREEGGIYIGMDRRGEGMWVCGL